MNEQPRAPAAKRYSPLLQLVLARFREFIREPEAVFWVYGFPILMVVALGIAFRNKPVEQIHVDVAGPATSESVKFVTGALQEDKAFVVRVAEEAVCRQDLKTAKTDLVVLSSAEVVASAEVQDRPKLVTYGYDPTRPESLVARARVDDALQKAAKRHSPLETRANEMTEPGGRYIDFLVPGLLGMSIMGGGLWGLGFVTVDMRIRKLLKRFLATPMRKSHFLLGLLLSRMMFMVPEVLILLLFAWLAFGVVIQGSLLAIFALILLGALAFSGIGLLVASRAQTLETVSGLMNLVMLPMWVLSGIFFSPTKFPEAMQPFIHALPLTQLIEALRNVSQEGATLGSQWLQMTILAVYAMVTFVLALKWFRWT
jgi:ABC-type multidrug transport system permease subunit